jgi:diaminopimelate decarboxylase
MDRSIKWLDSCLSIRKGRLFIEECDTVELVEKFGSPIYVVSENQLRSNVRQFKKVFEERWPGGRVDIMPAIKANWVLALRHILTQEGAGCDIYSPGELYAVLQTDVNPEKVSVNGGGKSPGHINSCIKAGVRITVDDIDELDIIKKEADRLKKRAKIRFRLKPDMPNLWKPSDFVVELVPIDLGMQVYKNGIPTEHVVEMGRRALGMENIEVTGFHIHLGRHHMAPWFWKGQMKKYARLIAKLKEEWGGYEPREIDIGGGIPSPRDPFAKIFSRLDFPLLAVFWILAFLLKILGNKARYKIISKALDLFIHKSPNKNPAPGIEQYADAITESLKSNLKRGGINPDGITLQIEPGRSMYGDTGIHLTRILKTKSQTKPIKWNWVLLDTTYFFMAGGALEYNLHDFILANKADSRMVKTVDIVGRSCFADRMMPEVSFPEAKSGDILAILDTGAYQEVSASNFNALPRPATVLVNGDKAEIVKRAETVGDVFRRDKVPERFVRKKAEQVKVGEAG